MRAVITRAKRLHGDLAVPGDKSISHRAVLFGAMAKGTTRVKGLSHGGDVHSSIECIRRLGVSVRNNAEALEIESPGRAAWSHGRPELDAGNSGTSARLLMGMLAPAEGLEVTLRGDASLSKRPMKRVAEPLRSMGASIELTEAGTLPATVSGRRLHAVSHELRVASAQMKTALLLAGLAADGETWVREPSLSRDHTERMLPLFGAEVLSGSRGVGVRRTELAATTLQVPGDPSSAAFFAAAAALVPGGEVTVRGVSTNPTRIGFLSVLERMGAVVELSAVSGHEPVGDWTIRASGLSGVTVEGAIIPALIDEVPILAIVAAFAEGTTTIRDAAELRVKESDRLALIARGLTAMGGEVEELPDGLIIHGGRPLHGAVIDPGMDHRIAMSFAVAALMADGETVIEGAEWVDTSFPGFFSRLSALTGGAVRTE